MSSSLPSSLLPAEAELRAPKLDPIFLNKDATATLNSINATSSNSSTAFNKHESTSNSNGTSSNGHSIHSTSTGFSTSSHTKSNNKKRQQMHVDQQEQRHQERKDFMIEDPCDFYASPITLDSSCRCPHLEALLPTILDSGGLGTIIANSRSSNNSSTMKAVKHCKTGVATVSDLHFQSLHSIPASVFERASPEEISSGEGSTGNNGNSKTSSGQGNSTNSNRRGNKRKPSLPTKNSLIPPSIPSSHPPPTNLEQSYPFGKEESKTDAIMTSGSTADDVHSYNSYCPIASGHFVESLHNQRSKERQLQESQYQETDVMKSTYKIEKWLQVIKDNRVRYWENDHRQKQAQRQTQLIKSESSSGSTFNVSTMSRGNVWSGCSLAENADDEIDTNRYTNNNRVGMNSVCKYCKPISSKTKASTSKRNRYQHQPPQGDELMQCLECSLIACGPTSSSCHKGQKSKQHMLQHLLLSNHNFAITCGPRGSLFCFKCGDFVYSEPLDREKTRVDILMNDDIGWLGWERKKALQRTFGFGVGFDDFVVVPDNCHNVFNSNGAGGNQVDIGNGKKRKTNTNTTSNKKISPSSESSNGDNNHRGTVVWRGFRGVYPLDAPIDLIHAGQRALHRWNIFHGNIHHGDSLAWGPKAMRLALLQHERGVDECWKIQRPVGLYNLGNTCFMSSVLQCLIHMRPLQKYFLDQVKHDYYACRLLRNGQEKVEVEEQHKKGNENETKKKNSGLDAPVPICLACEMDKMFLDYFGSSVGVNVLAAMEEPVDPSIRYIEKDDSKHKRLQKWQRVSPNASNEGTKSNKNNSNASNDDTNLKGVPLVTSDLLLAAWKCEGMSHLAGYDQRDAHEFLQAFLDVLGKHCNSFIKNVKRLKDEASLSHIETFLSHEYEMGPQPDIEDIVENTFCGTLRSVVICSECGFKRTQPESFVDISLPVAKEIVSRSQKSSKATVVTRRATAPQTRINLQSCLDQFTLPEPLGDCVHCPFCEKKTNTQKQLTFSRLPKILCLHLKRFDALTNKKITDPVSFPVELNMGPYLPHWREVSPSEGRKYNNSENAEHQIPQAENSAKKKKIQEENESNSCPNIIYELCSTIDHTGTLNQGHYVSNVKVNGQWYHCNDAFVSHCGDGARGEEEVLNSDAAYMMFYVRKF